MYFLILLLYSFCQISYRLSALNSASPPNSWKGEQETDLHQQAGTTSVESKRAFQATAAAEYK